MVDLDSQLLLQNRSDLMHHAISDIDDIVLKHAIVDGTSIPVYRIKSVPLISLNISDENNNGIVGVETYAVADGYRLYLKPLHSTKATTVYISMGLIQVATQCGS